MDTDSRIPEKFNTSIQFLSVIQLYTNSMIITTVIFIYHIISSNLLHSSSNYTMLSKFVT